VDHYERTITRKDARGKLIKKINVWSGRVLKIGYTVSRSFIRVCMPKTRIGRVVVVLALLITASVIGFLLISKGPDSRDAWKQVLSKCASTDVIGKDIIYFGASNIIGPGSVWRQEPDGSWRLRYVLADLEPDEGRRQSLVIPNNSAGCDSSTSAEWQVKTTLPFEGQATPLSGQLSDDLKKADKITVKIKGWQLDVLKEGPFETLMGALKAPFSEEFKKPNRVVAENAVRVQGFAATFAFSKQIAADLQAKYQTKSITLKDGAELKVNWASDTQLTLASPDEFYILAGFARVKDGELARDFMKPPSYLGSERSDPKEGWLQNASAVKAGDNYSDVLKKVTGTEPLRAKTERIQDSATLGDIAKQNYGDPRFWRLIAAANKDRENFDFQAANRDTMVKPGSIYEVWFPAKYKKPASLEEFKAVRADDLKSAYDDLLTLAAKGVKFDSETIDRLTDVYRERELSFTLTYTNFNDLNNLGELSIKYYGSRKYWPIIKWANPKLPKTANEGTRLKGNVVVPQFLP
jgi:nucleoid-associated protein YgaU